MARRGVTPAWLLDLLRPEVVKEGNRNPKLFKLACELKRNGLSDAEVLRTLEEYNKNNCRPPKTEAEVKDIAERVAATYVPPSTSRGKSQKKTLHCLYFDVVAHKANDALQALTSQQRGWWIELYTAAWLRRGYLPADAGALAHIALIEHDERDRFAVEYKTVLAAGGFELLQEGPSGQPQYIHHELACLYGEKEETVEKLKDLREQSRITKLYEQLEQEKGKAA